jgi:molybdopterin synthase sulfur carrier subunit
MRVQFYATLRDVVGEKTVDVAIPDGSTVRELALAIARRWPALAERMIDSDGEISRQVHFMIGGRNVRWLPDGSATAIAGNDRIEVFPPTAGG